MVLCTYFLCPTHARCIAHLVLWFRGCVSREGGGAPRRRFEHIITPVWFSRACSFPVPNLFRRCTFFIFFAMSRDGPVLAISSELLTQATPRLLASIFFHSFVSILHNITKGGQSAPCRHRTLAMPHALQA